MAILIRSLMLSVIVLIVVSKSEAQEHEDFPIGFHLHSPSPSPSQEHEDFPLILHPHSPSPSPSQSPFLIRPPRICRPRILDPAIECGCFRYYRLFSEPREWRVLKNACLKAVENNLQNGRRACGESKFKTRRGKFSNRKLAGFFRRARKVCIDPLLDPKVIHPAHQVLMFKNEETEDKLGQATDMLGFAPDSMASLVRPNYEQLHKKLSNFCFVVVGTVNGNPDETYCDCCPRDKAC